jgi:type IV pilus assembly protein PilY1
LADIAFAYWATDLRPDLDNNVPRYIPDRSRGVTTTPVGPVPADPSADPEIFWNPANDPATWQHMVNFTVGLGVAGVRAFPGDFVSLRTSVSSGVRWPGLVNLAPPGVDDLWRAGVVSRGGYFSANDPQELVDSLSATLNSVIVRRGTASAATVTSGIISTSTLAFRTGFDSGDWSGEVNAFTVEEDTGALVLPPAWEAGAVLLARVTAGLVPRQILTSSGATGGGIPFDWADLPADYQAALNDDPATGVVDDDGLGERRVEYIRGSQADEIDSGGPFRIRSKLLGAVVNSGAVVVAAPSAGYTDINFPVGSPERDAADLDPDAKYSKFRSDYRARDRLVFVGGNDGMMHAFDAGSGFSGTLGTGEERWAYVPREVAPSLSALTNPNFEYTPFVDTTPVVRDVFIGDRWRTLLVGGLRRGGQGIYALDITSPNVTEADAADVVLWEFSDDHPTEASAAQLGYTFGRPNISRLALTFGGDNGR